MKKLYLPSLGGYVHFYLPHEVNTFDKRHGGDASDGSCIGQRAGNAIWTANITNENTIVHECIHLVDFIMRTWLLLEETYDEDGIPNLRELRAYMGGYITNEALKYYRKQAEKQK